MLRWLHRSLADRELESINRTLVEAIIEAKQAEGCSNATVNRHLALLRAILRRCVCDWEWLARAPTIRLLKEPTRRIRFPESGTGAHAAARVATASARHGHVRVGDGLTRSECN